MSGLREALDDYLMVRRPLGFKLKNASYLLPKFVTHLEQTGATTITPRIGVGLGQAASREPDPVG